MPSIFPWRNNNIQGNDERGSRRVARSMKIERDSATEPTDEVLMGDADISYVANWCTVGEELSNNDVPIESLSGATNAEHSEEVCMLESSTQTPPRPMMSIDDFISDNEGMLFYTGLASHTDFHFVLHSLGPAAYHLRYLYNQVQNVSVENQFFLTLMKLRQNRTNYELGRMFGISKTTVDNIWITWVNFLARQFRDINFWPDRET